MAIDPSDLELWVGNEGISNSGTLGLSLSWEVRHTVIGEVVNSGALGCNVAKQSDLLATWNRLVRQAEQRLEGTRSFHEPIPAIGGYSLFDVDLIFDSWYTNDDDYKHPICGTLTGPVPNSLPSRLSFILGAVPPPPTWFWAESINPGELRVKCVAVAGADSYNVYDGGELLGNIPSNSWQTLIIPAGTYFVREAAVDGGQVGILSFSVAVEVA